MSDHRELLELAALAMGYKRSEVTLFAGWEIYVDTRGVSRQWEPDKDSGDTADMCAALGIGSTWWPENIECWTVADGIMCSVDVEPTPEFFRDHNNDRAAAWRMAALRVAAEIGRGMRG